MVDPKTLEQLAGVKAVVKTSRHDGANFMLEKVDEDWRLLDVVTEQTVVGRRTNPNESKMEYFTESQTVYVLGRYDIEVPTK